MSLGNALLICAMQILSYMHGQGQNYLNSCSLNPNPRTLKYWLQSVVSVLSQYAISFSIYPNYLMHFWHEQILFGGGWTETSKLVPLTDWHLSQCPWDIREPQPFCFKINIQEVEIFFSQVDSSSVKSKYISPVWETHLINVGKLILCRRQGYLPLYIIYNLYILFRLVYDIGLGMEEAGITVPLQNGSWTWQPFS